MQPALVFGDGLYEGFNSAAGSTMGAYGNLFRPGRTSPGLAAKHTWKAGVEVRINRDTTVFGIAPNGTYCSEAGLLIRRSRFARRAAFTTSHRAIAARFANRLSDRHAVLLHRHRRAAAVRPGAAHGRRRRPPPGLQFLLPGPLDALAPLGGLLRPALRSQFHHHRRQGAGLRVRHQKTQPENPSTQ